MNPLHLYRRHLRLLVLLAIAAYAVAMNTFGLLVVFGTAAIVSGYVTDGPRGKTLPRWAGNLLAVAGLGWTIIDGIDNPDVGRTMQLIGQLVIWLAVIKLYEDRTPKDDRQVAVLAVIAVIVGCLYSFQLLFGLIILVFAGQAVLFLMLHRLHTGLARVQVEREKTQSSGFIPVLEATVGRSPLVQFRILAIGSAAVAMFVATGVFMIFPRDAIGIGSVRGMQTGFSPEVDLNENDRIVESTREVFTVTWIDPAGAIQEWPQPLRLRGAVLNNYDPVLRKWFSDKNRNRRTITTRTNGQYVPLGSGAAEFERGTWTQVVTMRSLASDTVFAAWAPVAILCDQPRSFTLDPATLVMQDTSPDRLSRYWTYRLLVQPFPSNVTLESITGDASPPQVQVGFPVPGVRKETIRVLKKLAPELLEPIVGGDEELRWRRNREIAEVLSAYLQGEDFKYTLDLRDFVQSRSVDPLVQFLTDYRFGHCEYFASALAGMCRSIGVEARVVTGFVAVEFDSSLEHYVVRESNAHAWVEVLTGDWQWRTFDPTSSETLMMLQEEKSSWADDWRWMYDRADFLWNSRFVTFDGSIQATLAERVSTQITMVVKETFSWLGEKASRVNRFFKLGPAGYIWLGIVSFIVCTAIGVVIVRVRRRRILQKLLGMDSKSSGAQILAVGFYIDILKAFDRIGFPKPISVPPMSHLAGVRSEVPHFADVAEPLLRVFYDIRFGGKIIGADERKRIDIEVKNLLAVASSSRKDA